MKYVITEKNRNGKLLIESVPMTKKEVQEYLEYKKQFGDTAKYEIMTNADALRIVRLESEVQKSI